MLMMGADDYNDSSGLLSSGDPSAECGFDGFDADGLCIDLDTFERILGEDSDPLQSNPEDPSPRNMSQGNSAPESIQFHSDLPSTGFSFGDLLRHKSEASDARTESLVGSFDYHGKLESLAHDGSMVQTSSASFKDWCPYGQGTSHMERFAVSPLQMPSCSTASSFTEMDSNHVLDHGDNLNFDLVDDRSGVRFKNTTEEIDYKNALHSPAVGNMNLRVNHSGNFLNNNLETLRAPENKVARSMEFSPDADMTLHNVTSNESTICHGSDIVSDVSDPCSVIPYYMNGDDAYLADWSGSVDCVFEESMEDEVVEFPIGSACSNSRITFNAQGGGTDNMSSSQLSVTDFSDVKQQHFEGEGNEHVLPACGNSSYIANEGLFDDKGAVQPFSHYQPSISNTRQAVYVKNEDNKVITSGSGNVFCHYSEALDQASWRKSANGVDDSLSVHEDLKQSFSDISPSVSNQEFMVNGKDAHHYHQDFNLNISSQSALGDGHLNLITSEPYFSSTHPFISTKMHLGCFGDERESKLMLPRNMGLSKVSPESIHSNSSDCRSHVDDDPDICILEDISQPPCSNHPLVLVKKTPSLPNATISSPFLNSGIGGVRLKGNDERLIFRAALQGLSQPKSEASPPDGALTVPLLRHQVSVVPSRNFSFLF